RCPSGATSCGRSSRPTHPGRVPELLTTRSPDRRILLVDADAFYVAVARLVDPAGAGKAPLLIVGGSPERRGVVTSASYEARAYGVHSAMPMARAVRLCPNATVVPVPWAACARTGREINDGLAAGVAKPRAGTPADGVHVVAPGAELEFMRRFALADIPFIGPKFQERLAKLGLHAVSDVLRYESETLVGWLGRREGEWLAERVRGIDVSPVEPHRERKSISRDETVPPDLVEDDALAARLLALADRAAADLREAGLLARTVTVKLR